MALSASDLHKAAAAGDTSKVEACLAAGVEVGAILRGRTALHVAAAAGHLAVVDLLLDHGADIEAQGTGETPLVDAAYKGRTEVVLRLLDRGAELHGGRALLMAAQYDKPKTVAALVERGADLNGESLLASSMGSSRSSYRGLEALLIAGADPNRGMLPLHCAVDEAREKAVKILLAHGADPLRADDEGRTAIDLARAGQSAEHGRILDLLTRASSAPAKKSSTVRIATRPAKVKKPRALEVSAVAFGHAGGVKGLTWGPGDRIASTGTDLYLRLWDASSGAALLAKRVGTLTGWPITMAALSADGREVAGGAKTISVFDITSGKQTGALRHGKGGSAIFAFASDGTHVATGCGDAHVRLWHLASRTMVADVELPGVPGGLAFSPDGSHLLAACGEGARALLAVPSGTVLSSAPANGRGDAEPLFTEKGPAVVWRASDDDHAGFELAELDAASLEPHARLEVPGPLLCSAGPLLALDAGGVCIFDREHRRVVRTLPARATSVAAFSPDRSEIAFDMGWGLNVYGVDDGRCRLGDPHAFGGPPKHASFFGERVLGMGGFELFLWSCDLPGKTSRLEHSTGLLDGPAPILPRAVVGRHEDGPVVLGEAGPHGWLAYLDGNLEVVRTLALPAWGSAPRFRSGFLSEDGQRLLESDGSGVTRLVDLDRGAVVWQGAKDAVATFAGPGALAVGRAGRIEIVDNASGEARARWDVEAVRFGDLVELLYVPKRGLLLALLGNQVRAYAVGTGQPVAHLPAPAKAGIYSVGQLATRRMAVDAAARLLAVAADGTVELWDLASYTHVHSYRIAPGDCHVAFDTSGRHLAAVAEDGIVVMEVPAP